MSNLLSRLFTRFTGRGHRANGTASLDADTISSPREALSALVARLDAAISSSQQAFAEAVNAARSLEARQQTAREDADTWSDKARQAEARRRAAEASGADQRRLASLDALVRDAVQRGVNAEKLAAELQPLVDERTAQLKAIRADLERLERTREDLQDRRSELIARSSLAEAESQVAAVLADLASDSPTSELSRIESAVRTQEATAAGRTAVAALANPDKAFDDEFEALIAAHETQTRVDDLRKELE